MYVCGDLYVSNYVQNINIFYKDNERYHRHLLTWWQEADLRADFEPQVPICDKYTWSLTPGIMSLEHGIKNLQNQPEDYDLPETDLAWLEVASLCFPGD